MDKSAFGVEHISKAGQVHMGAMGKIPKREKKIKTVLRVMAGKNKSGQQVRGSLGRKV